MIKRLLISGVLFVAASGVVLAFSGNHSFTNGVTVVSNGPTYKGSYQATGDFPYNRAGVYDTSRRGNKVNLVGTLTVSEENGQPVQYCLKTQGAISSDGTGRLTLKYYHDLRCKGSSNSQDLTVTSYTEDGSGNFSLVTVDENGVTSTTTGVHSLN